MGSTIVTNLEHRGDHLWMTFQSYQEEAIRTTGGDEYEGEEIPAVQAYRVRSTNTARLYPKQ